MFERSKYRGAAARRHAGRGSLVSLLTLLVAAAALGQPQVPPPVLVPSAPHTPAAWRSKAVPGRLLVGLRTRAGAQHLRAIQTASKGRLSRVIAGGQVLVVDLPPGSDLLSACGKCLAQPDVAFVEPDTMIYPALAPNDPQYPQQYHLPLVRAPEAWDLTIGTGQVLLAVVDTGVDLDHPDLAAKIYTNPGEIPGNGLDDDHNGVVDDVHGWDFYNGTPDANPEPDGADDDANGTADDQVNHGTLVAGIAAAVGNEGWGTAGMDWRAMVLPVQVFPDDGGSAVSTVIQGIDYAVGMGADIINLSVGGDYAQSFTPAITAAYDAGILVVAAAGNSEREFTDAQGTWESPVCNDGTNLAVQNHVLAVASTDRNDRRASFSNYDGSSYRHFVDLCAPGEGIYGPAYYNPAFGDFDEFFTTNSGTSFSAPMASGLAALILSAHPTYGPDQLMNAIKSGCDNIDALNPGLTGKLGAGRLNAARALGVELAPRPPRDVQVQDTPNDEGGSITVTWLPSLDDGAGAESVTEYIVRRRLGVNESFVEAGRVSAGQTSFVDTGVTDGVNYYYKVRATDGKASSDSLLAGPVQSANDGAPPRLAGVCAQDRPGDAGGAMLVGWNPYTAPADFSHFAIYRSSGNFVSVRGLTPIAEIINRNAVLYTDQPTTDGADYYYAVTAVDTWGNEDKDVPSCGPVQSYANESMTLGAGLHFFSAPVAPVNPDPAAFLGIPPNQLNLARWRPVAGEYAYYTGPAGLAGVLDMRLGRGFWLLLDGPLSFDPTGTPTPGGDLVLELQPGWHQLGNPYFGPMDFALTTVTYQGTTMDLSSADAANIMRRFAWIYDRQQGSYRLVSPGLGSAGTEVPTWQGFWVRVEKLCTVALRRPSATASAAVARAAEKRQDGWVAGLCARAGSSQDLDNFFGVRPDLADQAPILSPPPAGRGVALDFVEPRNPGMRIAAVFSGAAIAEAAWDVVVQVPEGAGELELWCPDLTRVPSGYHVLLEDTAAGSQVDLGRTGRYRCALRDKEQARSFVLRLTRSAGVLTLSSVVAQPTRAGGAQVTFALSAPAACNVRLLNIAGRTVRVLEQGRSRPAGLNEVLWDGRADAGSRVPNGTYLVMVEAAGTDGAKVQAIRSLMVQR